MLTFVLMLCIVTLCFNVFTFCLISALGTKVMENHDESIEALQDISNKIWLYSNNQHDEYMKLKQILGIEESNR